MSNDISNNVEDLDYSNFVRIPFEIRGVQITEENMDVVHGLVGHEIRTLEDGARVIILDRKKIRAIREAVVGSWLCVMNGRYRVYTDRAFRQSFCGSGGAIEDNSPTEDASTVVASRGIVTRDGLPPKVGSTGYHPADNYLPANHK